eukprot:scaffold707_cov399-Prasinococcus_capsulatus_cf.AAC.26
MITPQSYYITLMRLYDVASSAHQRAKQSAYWREERSCVGKERHVAHAPQRTHRLRTPLRGWGHGHV